MTSSQTSKAQGQRAEDLALDYLLKKTYVLADRNYRHKKSEIDLIVRKQNTLVFVEVKYRSSAKFGHPETFVSPNQQRTITEGAEHYIIANNWQGDIRFDIIAVDAQYHIEHFEDAFY